MANKKQIRQGLNRLKSLKIWQLLIVFVLVCFVAATFLRLNNIGMVDRREAVLSADKSGNGSAVQDRLYDLQRYVSAHMNADTGNVYLQDSYNLAVQAAYAKAAGAANPNGNIHKKAQEVCAPRYSTWSNAYVQCTVAELAKYPSGESLASEVKVPLATYRHVYVSPLWSPDFAGWAVLICVVILIMIIARITGVVILRMLLRRRYKSI